MSESQAWIGRRVPRYEDARILGAAVRYIADQGIKDAWHLRLVRSPLPNGRLIRIHSPAPSTSARVFTAADLTLQPPVMRMRYHPRGFVMPDRPLLAIDRVRFVGESLAAVIA